MLALLALALAAAPHLGFSAQTFFAGRTEGVGRLKVALSRAKTTRVTGRGRVTPDGELVLDQTVAIEGSPERTREWRIREVAPGRYAGTLSDASGPVSGEVIGGELHLRFHMKGGLRADQWLACAPGCRVTRNRMTVRKLGVVVARLNETIRKTP